jgi:bifunctional non-homologous end joining protein LigD
VVCEKAADLIYLTNLGCITPHVWLSRVDRPDRPDRLILDLDPGSDDFQLVKETAIMARRLLSEDGLESLVMTTGSRGLHVVAPLDRSADFDAVRSYAQKVAEEMVEMDDRLTTERSVEEREGRLLVDVFRNSYAQTSVAPYAVRARDGAPVAAPLSWEELDDPGLGPQSFNILNVWSRAEANLWKNIGERGGHPPRR